MFKGHPRGLAPLFFTELWERLGFYLLIGILVLYGSDLERGGLGLTEKEANGIYGTYMAFVYFTPFLGGIIADRLLGYRKSVFIGGLFFVLGYYLLGLAGKMPFYAGLISLCIGNGLFKPNISAMVGNLYQPGDEKRDSGFNLFYMGINIGAAAANLLAAPIRNEWGWKWAFWSAAIGNAIGLIILVANWKRLAAADVKRQRSADEMSVGEIFGTILLPAAIFGAAGYFLAKSIDGFPVSASMTGFLLGMLPVFAFFVRTAKKAPPEEKPGLEAVLPIFLAGGTFFMILHLNGSALTKWADEQTNREVSWAAEFWKQDALPSYYSNADASVARPDERTFVVVDDLQGLLVGMKALTETEFNRLVLPEDVKSRPIWTDAGGVVANTQSLQQIGTFVYADSQVAIKRKGDPTEGDKVVEKTTAELIDGAHPDRKLIFERTIDGKSFPVLLVSAENKQKVYAKATDSSPRLPPGELLSVVNPEIYQSWNPIYVVLLTPLLVPFWTLLKRRGREVSTARKLFYGMLLTSAAVGVMVIAAFVNDEGSVKVAGAWLVGFYFIVTLGELCLSPMGLSLVTKLSPKRLVGMMMGGWFCATAFGNKLSGFLGELRTMVTPVMFFLIIIASALLVASYLYFKLPRLEATLKQYKA